MDETGRQCLMHFADLLEYPRATIADTAGECAALLEEQIPDAAVFLREFQTRTARLHFGQLEELYTGTFDLDPVCYPYVGYHVFGETYKRSVFLVALKERYRETGLQVNNELSDHVAVMLRHLSLSPDDEDRDVILREAMLPALQRMTGRARSAGHDDHGAVPADVAEADDRHLYRGVLEALRLLLLEMAGVAEDEIIELAQPAQRSLAH